MKKKDVQTSLEVFSVVTGVIGLIADIVALTGFISSYNLFREPSPIPQHTAAMSLFSIWNSPLVRGVSFCFLLLGVWGLVTIFYQRHFLKTFISGGEKALDYYQNNSFIAFIQKAVKPRRQQISIEEIALLASSFFALNLVFPLFLIWLRVFYVPCPSLLLISLDYGLVVALLSSLLLLRINLKRSYAITLILSFAISSGFFLTQEINPFLGIFLALLTSIISCFFAVYGTRILASLVARGLSFVYISEVEFTSTNAWVKSISDQIQEKQMPLFERWEKKGDELLESNPEKSLAAYSHAISLKPSKSLYLKRMNLLEKMARLDNALEDAETAYQLSNTPDDRVKLLTMICKWNIETGRKDQIQPVIEKALAAGLDCSNIYAGIAEAAKNKKDYMYAFGFIERAIQMNPTLMRYQLGADLAFAIQNYSKAMLYADCARDLLLKVDDNSGDFISLINTLALGMNKKDGIAYFELIKGVALDRIGETQPATELLLRSLAGGNFEAAYYLGLIYHRQKDYQRAIQMFTKVIEYRRQPGLGILFLVNEKHHKYWDAALARGGAYAESGEFEKAEADLNTFLSKNIKSDVGLCTRAIIHSKQHRVLAARQDFELAINYGSDNYENWHQYVLFESSLEPDKALAILRRAIARIPSFTEEFRKDQNLQGLIARLDAEEKK